MSNNTSMMRALEIPKLKRSQHAMFFAAHLKDVPAMSFENNRLTMLHFALTGLDMLHELNTYVLLDSINKKDMIDWVYSLQLPSGGFVGSCNSIIEDYNESNPYFGMHLPSTYSAFCVLLALGDNLSRVDIPNLCSSISALQSTSGCFYSSMSKDECDTRFIFCVAAIFKFLELFRGECFKTLISHININQIALYIESCKSYDGAYGLYPYAEGHGGATYTATASVYLLDLQSYLPTVLNPSALLGWCIERQGHGYCGRINKSLDCCYSYWVGAILRLLQKDDLLHESANKRFNVLCEGPKGGFGKEPAAKPDILHTFYGIAGLSLMYYSDTNNLEEESLSYSIDSVTDEDSWHINRLHPALGVTVRVLSGKYVDGNLWK